MMTIDIEILIGAPHQRPGHLHGDQGVGVFWRLRDKVGLNVLNFLTMLRLFALQVIADLQVYPEAVAR